MKQISWLLILLILVSGCTAALPLIKATDQKPPVETETVWVNAKTKKIWVNPHVDEEGNMIEGHYKFIVLEKGHWALQEIAPENTITNKKESK